MSILTEPTTDIETTDREGSSSGSDWWCIQVDEFQAPHPCNHQLRFVSGVMEGRLCHLIMVWDEKDNEEMLRIAALSQKRGRNPKIVEYKESFGPWINYDNYKLYGGPDK